jgi:hypothetical protein
MIQTSAGSPSAAGEYPADRKASCIAALSQEFTLQPKVSILKVMVSSFRQNTPLSDNI